MFSSGETGKVGEKDIKKQNTFQYQDLRTTHGHPKERGRSNVRKNTERERDAAGWRCKCEYEYYVYPRNVE